MLMVHWLIMKADGSSAITTSCTDHLSLHNVTLESCICLMSCSAHHWEAALANCELDAATEGGPKKQKYQVLLIRVLINTLLNSSCFKLIRAHNCNKQCILMLHCCSVNVQYSIDTDKLHLLQLFGRCTYFHLVPIHKCTFSVRVRKITVLLRRGKGFFNEWNYPQLHEIRLAQTYRVHSVTYRFIRK